MDCRRLPSSEWADVDKAAENFGRLAGGGREGQIELRGVGGCAVAAVGECEAHIEAHISAHAAGHIAGRIAGRIASNIAAHIAAHVAAHSTVAGDAEAGVVEAAVGEAVAEWVGRHDPMGVVIAVANEEALCVARAAVLNPRGAGLGIGNDGTTRALRGRRAWPAQTRIAIGRSSSRGVCQTRNCNRAQFIAWGVPDKDCNRVQFIAWGAGGRIEGWSEAGLRLV